jgi:hypothetical protein
MKRQLRNLSVGDTVACLYQRKIFIGELLSPYNNESLVHVLYYIPRGSNRFERPTSTAEWERNEELTPIEDIIRCNIHMDGQFVDPAQFT